MDRDTDEALTELRIETEQELVDKRKEASERLAGIRRELDAIRLGLVRVQARSITVNELRAKLGITRS